MPHRITDRFTHNGLGVIGKRRYSTVTMIGSLLMLVALWLMLTRTRIGLVIQAALTHPETVEALGHNVPRVMMLVFGGGTALAALAVGPGGSAGAVLAGGSCLLHAAARTASRMISAFTPRAPAPLPARSATPHTTAAAALHQQLQLVLAEEPLNRPRRIRRVVPQPVLVTVGIENQRTLTELLLKAVGVQLGLLLAVVYMIMAGLIVLLFKWLESRVPSRTA